MNTKKKHNDNKAKNINSVVIDNAVNGNELIRENNKKSDNLLNDDLEYNITESGEYYDYGKLCY